MSISCIGNEALLQVKLSLTQDELFIKSRGPFWDRYWEEEEYWEFEDEEFEDEGENGIGIYPFVRHQQGDEFSVKKFNPKDLMDYEACVPRDDCSQIVVGGVPTDGYELLFDGKAIDPGYEFYFDALNPVTYTTVGSCTTTPIPVCNDAEALFELRFWSGTIGSHDSTFRVEDQDGNSVLSGSLGGSFSLDKTYACLPKDDACYTFLIGIQEQRDPTNEAASSYTIFFDGELVGSSETWLFESVRFGSCGPSCEEDESVVEFFMYHEMYPDEEFEYKWNLSSPSVSISGVVPHGPGISFLAHETMCVPKGSCASFYIEDRNNVTQTYEDEVLPEGITDWADPNIDWDSLEVANVTVPINVQPVFMISMDNVEYRRVDWGILNQTTNMGDCTYADLCNEQTEDLFYVERRIPADLKTNWGDIPPTPLLMSGHIGAEDWNFGYIYHKDNGKLKNLLTARNYINRASDLNTTLKVFECVPKDGCDLSLNFTAGPVGAPREQYNAKKNGMQLTDGQFVGNVFGSFVTPFGQNCPFSFSSSNALTLSGGAIASVVVVAITVLIWD
mmetsp:Transcript_12836/g.18410  ORF Transcript_12836/g.18410 Transcript_12836/m.18410 type:complete len:560 (-) Transcript_12836:270-1949(-)